MLITDTTERAQAAADLAFLAAVGGRLLARVVDGRDRARRERALRAALRRRASASSSTTRPKPASTIHRAKSWWASGASASASSGSPSRDAKPRVWKPQEVDLIGALARQLHPVLQRAAAEDALRASRERLRLIVENARDYAILTVDLDRRITSWNPGAERLTGYAADEADRRRPPTSSSLPKDRAAGAPQREAQDGDRGRPRKRRALAHAARRLAVLGQRLDARDARRVGRGRGLAQDLPRPDGRAARQGSAGAKPPGAVGSAAGNRARAQGCRGRGTGQGPALRGAFARASHAAHAGDVRHGDAAPARRPRPGDTRGAA